MFFRSATGLSSAERYSSGSGRVHTDSPAHLAASETWPVKSSLLPISPAIRLPSATMTAPVSVARSMMASGLASAATDRASASTRRPSASVLSTSTVLPLCARNTSPGRCASGPGMLSVSGTKAVTRWRTFSAGRAHMAASTEAPPPLSIFIVIMPSPVLSDRPPESNVMPLPTSARCAPAPSALFEVPLG